MSTLTKEDLDIMLVDMMRNFNASLERMNEKIEKSTQEIAQTNQRVETLSTQVIGEGRIINNEQPRGIMRNFPIDNDRDLKLLELPEFTGDGDAEDFLDWVRQMEKVFDYKGFDEQKAYKVANLKLTRYASLWFENLRAKRLREDEPRINTWNELKRQLRKRFLPREFIQDQFLKLNHLEQKNLSVAEYTKEFEKLCMLCDLQEKEEMKIGRYIKGLTPSISHKVETSNYVFFDDVLRLAERFEKQEKEKKISYFKERKSFFNGEGSNINSNNSNNEGKMIVVTPEQATLAKKVCFKCQGMGHIARDCGNKVTVSKKEHRMLLAYLDQEEKEKESTCLLNTEEEFDFEEFEGQEKITPEPEHHHIGILRRVLHANFVPPTTHEQRENLFHTICKVGDRSCSLIIDTGSCTNVASTKLVDTMNLSTRDHPTPYKLNWLHDGDGLQVKRQALVNFSMGSYSDSVWCDILPMTACSILLGRPWQYDRGVLFNGVTNVYSVKVGDKRVQLHPLPPKAPPIQAPARELLIMPKLNKKERRANMLSLRNQHPFEIGEYVFLSLNAQKIFNNSRGKNEPLEEGPFKIVHRENYDTFQVLLGAGICATMRASDLVPCLPNET